jgi:hypothetical protein
MHRDIQLIHEKVDFIDGMVIPAHILAYQAASTSVFVTSLPENTPYIIDPMTYIFQNKRSLLAKDRENLRPSVKKMCDAYHDDIAKKVLALRADAVLQPGDYPRLPEMCDNIVKFQEKVVAEASGSSGASKYLKRYDRTEATLPRLIVPPYFRFSRVGDLWYQHSLECASHVAGLELSRPVAPIIFASKKALEGSGIDTIVKDYSTFNHVILWIDNYRHTTVTEEEIGLVRRLIHRLDEGGANVESLYGGYLLILSAHDGLDGISHGILYTESKSMELTPGSGGPPDRYYIPQFHEFRSMAQTDLIFHRHPELMCDCDVCRKTLAGNPDNIILYYDNPELLRGHFLSVRRSEADRIGSSSLAEEVAALRSTYATYHSSIVELPNPDAFVRASNMRGLDYLNEWANAFSPRAT